MDQVNRKYKRAMVFSGGGTRFAMYCGMFTAFEEKGLAPDLLIGVCGGSIAAAIINSFPTNRERKNYLQSKELFEFVQNTKLTKERKLHRIGWYSLKKTYSKKRAPFMENVFDNYLVDLPQDISLQLPSLSSQFAKNIPCIIVGSKIVLDPSNTGKERQNKKLYNKVLFTDPITAQKIDLDKIKIRSENYELSAVDPSIEILTDVSPHLAMRISVSDMFYVKPVLYQNQYYAGGAIDLTPIELAFEVADEVILEKKNNYTQIEESLVRAVLGFSGNQRLKEIENSTAAYWIDTTDATQVLNGHYCQKKIDWKNFEIKIELPESYEKFVNDMQQQWQYGYDKAIKELQQ
ncbi:patatin-like phospholipase family protein [Flavobacterium hungaricum]|uniref:Patatin-like phospholipase family protein n=1 Tax=Flavobacterium hungaricum TaxID=2082725 RepID=A0ABR9TR94_9FLAO|nr:patatin-like phospholipase family protein [Flavobacterium hungaricum]MBE8727905.1 patatin-like phospholipase family protein [Flavobacterium hungaricum]